MPRSVVPIAVVVTVALVVPAQTRGPDAALHFRVLAQTGIRLTDVAWTGTQLLYVENTTNTVWSAPPVGKPTARFASMPKQVEETRCRVSPGTHGWQPGLIFCHAPGNTIYRITADGSSVTVFAKLPETAISDGGLAFDTVGRFGYGLVAATGRSGSNAAKGGDVYAIAKSGSVRKVGHYDGPGGADEVEIAPATFGRAAGAALLTVDAAGTGRLVAVASSGKVTDVARLSDGPNPIAAIVATARRGANRAGLYLTDTLSRNVYFAPASDVLAYRNSVIVGSELKGLFWVIRPRGQSFETRQLTTTLRGKHYNLEGMAYVAP
jgi:hypothetical protein